MSTPAVSECQLSSAGPRTASSTYSVPTRTNQTPTSDRGYMPGRTVLHTKTRRQMHVLLQGRGWDSLLHPLVCTTKHLRPQMCLGVARVSQTGFQKVRRTQALRAPSGILSVAAHHPAPSPSNEAFRATSPKTGPGYTQSRGPGEPNRTAEKELLRTVNRCVPQLPKRTKAKAVLSPQSRPRRKILPTQLLCTWEGHGGPQAREKPVRGRGSHPQHGSPGLASSAPPPAAAALP